MTTTLTLTSEAVIYRRLGDGGGWLAAESEEVVTNPPAPPAEVDAPRLVVVTGGEYSSDYEIGGVVELSVFAPDIDTLRGLFTEHIRSIRGVDPMLTKDVALIPWLVERGFARRVAAAELNFAVYGGWDQKRPVEVELDEYTCPR